MDYVCGVDIGASAAKLVILDERSQVAGKAIRRSGVDYTESAEACLADALSQAGAAREQVRSVVATGYGRDNVPWADATRTEIACHGAGEIGRAHV